MYVLHAPDAIILEEHQSFICHCILPKNANKDFVNNAPVKWMLPLQSLEHQANGTINREEDINFLWDKVIRNCKETQ